jgi:hypothetical protein
MTLSDELARIANLAGARGPVTGVLAAEPVSGRRAYLVALGEGEERRWLVLDDGGSRIEEQELVREIASLVAMCELAGDVAGGGDVGELRAHLARLRVTERPDGIDEAEEAALELERTVGAPPRVARPEYLDRVGVATRRLERALRQQGSPFANAVAAASGAVEAFVREVETRNVGPLR